MYKELILKSQLTLGHYYILEYKQLQHNRHIECVSARTEVSLPHVQHVIFSFQSC